MRDHPLPDIVIPEARLIYISGEMDEELNTKAVLGLYRLMAESKDNITLLFNSPGGELFSGNSLTDTIEDIKRQGITVIGRVQGEAASAAVFALVTCSYREASPNSVVMVHGMHDASAGDLRHHKANNDLNAKLIQQQAKLLSARTIIPEVDWLPWLEDQLPHYFMADEALAAGIIDEIR